MLVLVTLSAPALASCAGDVRDVPWEISFSDESLRRRAVVVVAQVYEGSCRVLSVPVWQTELVPGRATPANEPPALSSGSYAFHAVARDVACNEFAAVCADVELPDAPLPVRTSLEPTTATPGCSSGCLEGRCVDDACPIGLAECDGDDTTSCEASLSSPASCGGCFLACSGATPLCSLRDNRTHVCSDSCASGTTECSGACADLTADARHCGACGNACPAGAHGVATCEASTCRLTCETGFGDCNASAADGCETSVLLDDANCGGCGVRCGAGQRCLGTMCFGA